MDRIEVPFFVIFEGALPPGENCIIVKGGDCSHLCIRGCPMVGNVTGSLASNRFRDRKGEAFEAPQAVKEPHFRSASPFALSTAFFFYWPSYHLAQKTPDGSAKEDVRQ
jgi:hypothetical protein